MTISLVLGAVHIRLSAAEPERFLGLPVTRMYSYEEIGNITRANHLTFDSAGRITAIRDGAYVVLNDTAWLDLAVRDPDVVRILHAVCDSDGTTYFGGLGVWGVAVPTPTGLLRPESWRPPSCPDWVHRTHFTDILCRTEGVYFRGFNGVAFWDRKTGQHAFLELVGFRSIFTLGERVYVSSDRLGVAQLEHRDGRLETSPAPGFEGLVIEHAVPLDESRVLLATSTRRFLLHEQGRLSDWSTPLDRHVPGRITTMKPLVDGGVAVAIGGSGLYILGETGEVTTALRTPEYQGIMDLANNEPGVLWAAAETGVGKVLYGGPVSMAGPPLGLPVSWPQVVVWHDRTFVASAGRLYLSLGATPTTATQFQLVPTQPTERLWAIAASENGLLVGNADGVFIADDELRFTSVLRGMDVARLALVGPRLCFVIGATEITALRFEAGQWRECSARVPGLGYPSVVHATARAAWIELGANRVARINLDAGDRVQARLFDSLPWKIPSWTNVSVLGDTVMFANRSDGWLFFDDARETFQDDPELRRLLERAPHLVSRLCVDDEGVLWASHERGVFRILREDDGTRFDTTTCGVINDASPLVQVTADGGVWIASGESLYHVNRHVTLAPKPALRPALMSVRDRRTNLELFRAGAGADTFTHLRYKQNSVDFRFFSGSYAARRPPSYEFRINRDPWSSLGLNSLLTLSDLPEGSYRLDVRVVDNQGRAGDPSSFVFAVSAPWYRTGYAYAGYLSAGLFLVFAVVRFSLRRARSHNLALERTVQERTAALRETMQRLNDETRNSATLAERQRLACEIHDSVQQALSGLMWQLDTTLKTDGVQPALRSRLGIARSMVLFARQEVQNAVWDMESPLLAGTELAGALRRLTELIDSGIARIELTVTGLQTKLSPSAQHHLLRIVQEAVTNAVRHGEAGLIMIELLNRDDFVSLSVRDDGRGFDPDLPLGNEAGHFGLRSLRTRADKIGASIQIESTPGKGTIVTVRLPVESPACEYAPVI